MRLMDVRYLVPSKLKGGGEKINVLAGRGGVAFDSVGPALLRDLTEGHVHGGGGGDVVNDGQLHPASPLLQDAPEPGLHRDCEAWMDYKVLLHVTRLPLLGSPTAPGRS